MDVLLQPPSHCHTHSYWLWCCIVISVSKMTHLCLHWKSLPWQWPCRTLTPCAEYLRIIWREAMTNYPSETAKRKSMLLLLMLILSPTKSLEWLCVYVFSVAHSKQLRVEQTSMGDGLDEWWHNIAWYLKSPELMLFEGVADFSVCNLLCYVLLLLIVLIVVLRTTLCNGSGSIQSFSFLSNIVGCTISVLAASRKH